MLTSSPRKRVACCLILMAVIGLSASEATPALAKSRKVSHVAPDYFDAYQAPAPGSQALLVARLTLGPGNNFDFAAAPDDQLAKKPKARRPNVYSGITQDTSDDRYLTYIGISDRGPVSKCHAEPRAKNFVWPHYSPTIYQLRPNPDTNSMDIITSCPLRIPFVAASPEAPSEATHPETAGNPDIASGDNSLPASDAMAMLDAAVHDSMGKKQPKWSDRGVTGLPNTDNDDVPYTAHCSEKLERTPNGIDSEDIQKIPNSPYCIGVDEYSPSVFIFNCDLGSELSCGEVLVRYVPEGLADAMAGAAYNVTAILPHALTYRRRSRGFEGLALSPDGQTAIAVMQSAMGDEHGKQKHSHSMLAVMLNVTNPLAATLQATHVILAKDAHSFAPDDDGRSKTRPRDIKISGATWIGHLMGRPADPIVLLLVRGIDQVLAQAADFSSATDVTEILQKHPLKFDDLGNHSKSRIAMHRLGIHHAHLRTFFNSGDVSTANGSNIAGIPNGVKWSDKQEALTVINECTLGIANDNDFVGDSELWVIQLPQCLSAGMTRTTTHVHVMLMVLLGIAIAGAGFGIVIHAATRYNPQQYEPM